MFGVLFYVCSFTFVLSLFFIILFYYFFHCVIFALLIAIFLKNFFVSAVMRVFAFTDLHVDDDILSDICARITDANKNPDEKVDYIICTGDISIFGDGWDEILSKLNELSIPILLVHGNHEDEHMAQDAAQRYEHVIDMHENVHVTDDILFMGYGGGGFARVDPSLASFVESQDAVLSQHADKKLVLLIHGPPHGTSLDVTPFFGHVGCTTRRDIVERLQPHYLFCGHIHECEGLSQKIGKSTLVNPGRIGDFFDL